MIQDMLLLDMLRKRRTYNSDDAHIFSISISTFLWEAKSEIFIYHINWKLYSFSCYDT